MGIRNPLKIRWFRKEAQADNGKTGEVSVGFQTVPGSLGPWFMGKTHLRPVPGEWRGNAVRMGMRGPCNLPGFLLGLQRMSAEWPPGSLSEDGIYCHPEQPVWDRDSQTCDSVGSGREKAGDRRTGRKGRRSQRGLRASGQAAFSEDGRSVRISGREGPLGQENDTPKQATPGENNPSGRDAGGVPPQGGASRRETRRERNIPQVWR